MNNEETKDTSDETSGGAHEISESSQNSDSLKVEYIYESVTKDDSVSVTRDDAETDS